jgi:hypothetical protein
MLAACSEFKHPAQLTNKEDFEVNIWTLRITNKPRWGIKKTLFKARTKIFIENLSSNESDLLWRDREEPFQVIDQSNISGPNFREQYLLYLGWQYTSYGMVGIETADLMPELSREAYFLFAIEDSPLLYVKLSEPTGYWTPDANRIMNRKMREDWLCQDMPTQFRFHLRVIGEGYSEGKQREYEVDAKSWDDIRLIKL